MTIDRRRFLGTMAATAAAIAMPNVVAGAARAAAQPNILLIITDDQPKETEWALAKVIGWLGGSGTTFASGHCTTPICGPSRASIMTGRFAHNHGVLNNGSPAGLDHSTTLQAHLQQAGYRTGIFGKYLNKWPLSSDPPYFDSFGIITGGYANSYWNINGARRRRENYTTQLVGKLTRDFMAASAQDPRPWFAMVTPFACHEPYTAEPLYAEAPVSSWDGRPSVFETYRKDKPPYVRAGTADLADGTSVRTAQLRTLLSVDDMVQKLRDQLVASGQLDKTLVIFIGDNGYMWADHGLVGKGAPYAPADEVPFYLSWPAGGYGSSQTDARIVANIDIAPTVLAAAGVAPASPMDGQSLFSSAARDHLLLEHWNPNGVDGRWWASWYSKEKQYVESYDSSGAVSFAEYYDLVTDPFQLKNLLYRSTPEQQAALGIPQLAAMLAADRVS